MGPGRASALIVALTLAWGSPAAAAPPTGTDPEVEAILATADPDAMRVVWTTTDAKGRPSVQVEPVTDKAAARSVVARELADPDTVAVSMDQRRRAVAANDPLRGDQWALDALHAEAVHRLNQGNAPTQARVAVIDSGVSAGHPDLSANVSSGYNAITGAEGGSAGQVDLCGHGTHVAGIVAAVTGNGAGVASLAPRARILPVTALDATCNGFVSDEVEGIYWAVDEGAAQVLNLSVGGAYDANEEIAVQYAIDHGVAVVAAAGNDGCGGGPSPDRYPAALSGVLGVAAIDTELRVASFSSCGDWVDVAAPGVGILSTMAPGNVKHACGAAYCGLSGTSMATPYAAAAVALAVSACSVSGVQAAASVKAKAHDLGPPGSDQFTGSGMVDPLPVVQSGCGTGPAPAYSQLAGSSPYVRLYPSRDSGFTCGGKPVNIVGTEATETIAGTGGDDVILANGGDDTVRGGGGNDVVCAGDGNDTVNGGPGNDYLRGQAGADRVGGDLGDDILFGDAGKDGLWGGDGHDRLVGGSDADFLDGGLGFDWAYYNDHTAGVAASLSNRPDSGNSIDGPAGARDRLSFGIDGLVGGSGHDVLVGGQGRNALVGGAGNDKLGGGGGDDYLRGDAGIDAFWGGPGNDSINAKDGVRDRHIDGGPGADSATVDRIDPKLR